MPSFTLSQSCASLPAEAFKCNEALKANLSRSVRGVAFSVNIEYGGYVNLFFSAAQLSKTFAALRTCVSSFQFWRLEGFKKAMAVEFVP